MAPPLLPLTRLVLCSGCSVHVKRGEVLCPHCGAAIDGRGALARSVGLAAMAGLLGISCNTVDPAYGTVEPESESGVGTTAPTGDGTTEVTTAPTEAGTTAPPSTGDTTSEPGTDTGTGTGTDTGTGTGTDTDTGTGTGTGTGTDTGTT